jgi:hypothetical protein
MKSKKSITLYLCFITKILFCQDSVQTENPKIKLAGIQFIRGFQASNSLNYIYEDFNQLEKKVQNGTTRTWQEVKSPIGDQKNVGLNLEFSLFSKSTNTYRTNQSLRIGLWYQKRTLNALFNAQNKYQNIDTLLSDYDSTYIYRRTNDYDNSLLTHQIKCTSLDVSYLFRSNQESQLSVFGGIGLNLGFTNTNYLKSESRTGKSEFFTTALKSDSNAVNSSFFDEIETQETNLKTAFYKSIYFPAGLSLRLSKSVNSYFNNVFFSFEIRPVIDFLPQKTFTSLHYNGGILVRI